MSPIRASERGRYPANWGKVSLSIRRDRANWYCECQGQCGVAHHSFLHGRCGQRQGWLTERGTAAVVLTVAHLDHTPENCDPSNLLAMCQACHLRYDAEHHATTARETRRQRLRDAGQADLWEGEP